MKLAFDTCSCETIYPLQGKKKETGDLKSICILISNLSIESFSLKHVFDFIFKLEKSALLSFI